MIPALVVASVVILASAAYYLWAIRGPVEALVHYFRCPDCGQKLRYAATRAGRKGVCPRCLRRWMLPATPQPLAGEETGRAPGFGLRRPA